MPLSKEKQALLDAMTPEQLMARKKQLESKMTGRVFRGAITGGLQGLSGQKITGIQP